MLFTSAAYLVSVAKRVRSRIIPWILGLIENDKGHMG
jgi:hypothetical protein